MNEMIRNLRELTCMREELDAEIDAIKDKIKGVMTSTNTEELSGIDWKVSYKIINSSRLDSKAFKADYPEIAKKYTKTTATRRLTIA